MANFTLDGMILPVSLMVTFQSPTLLLSGMLKDPVSDDDEVTFTALAIMSLGSFVFLLSKYTFTFFENPAPVNLKSTVCPNLPSAGSIVETFGAPSDEIITLSLFDSDVVLAVAKPANMREITKNADNHTIFWFITMSKSFIAIVV